MNQFLSEAETILASAQDIPTTLDRLARAAVPVMADFCFIFLLAGGNVRAVACAHSTPQGERLLRRLLRVYRITRNDPISTVAHVVRTGRPRLRSAIGIGIEAATPFADLHVFRLHQRLGVRSALVVPIKTTSRVLGAISLSYGESGRRYTVQHVRTAARLGRMTAGLLLQRARIGARRPSMPVPSRRSLRVRARA